MEMQTSPAVQDALYGLVVPPDVVRLYRPAGLVEMEAILAAHSLSFPSRAKSDPYFFPSPSPRYAEVLARDSYARDPESGHAGFVVRFDLDSTLARGFEEQVLGGGEFRRLCVPSAALVEMNSSIRGRIQIEAAHYGEGYVGPRGTRHPFVGLGASAQLAVLDRLGPLAEEDLEVVVLMNMIPILLNFGWWAAGECPLLWALEDRRDALLDRIARAWTALFPLISLPRGTTHAC